MVLTALDGVAPSGSFMMGLSSDQPRRLEGEGPQHTVTIAKPFAIGMFSVTRRLGCLRADGGCRGYKPSGEGWGRGTRALLGASLRRKQA